MELEILLKSKGGYPKRYQLLPKAIGLCTIQTQTECNSDGGS